VEQFLQAAVYGLLQGGILALIAMGFSLVWGVMNIINLSHGALVVTGAYLAWWLNTHLGIDPFVAVPIVAICLFIIGYAIQRGLVNLVANGPIFLTLLLTYGIGLVITNCLQLGFTTNDRSIPTAYAVKSLVVGGVHFPAGRSIACFAAVAATVALALMMTRTRLGQAISATGMDRGAARLMGIPVRHVYAVTFGVAAALAGVAGAMKGAVDTFNPSTTPLEFTFDGFVVSILGGLGNMYGALLGGIVLGLAESIGGLYLTGSWVNAIAMGVLIVTLLLRPAGLVGRAYFSGRVEV
jgi:branched-chain amino acid transport system permease protein